MTPHDCKICGAEVPDYGQPCPVCGLIISCLNCSHTHDISSTSPCNYCHYPYENWAQT
jgi:hypothetical protein